MVGLWIRVGLLNVYSLLLQLLLRGSITANMVWSAFLVFRKEAHTVGRQGGFSISRMQYIFKVLQVFLGKAVKRRKWPEVRTVLRYTTAVLVKDLGERENSRLHSLQSWKWGSEAFLNEARAVPLEKASKRTTCIALLVDSMICFWEVDWDEGSGGRLRQ